MTKNQKLGLKKNPNFRRALALLDEKSFQTDANMMALSANQVAT